MNSKDYDSQYYVTINDKLKNKNAKFGQKLSLSNQENEITNKLLYYYDKNFNSYYDEDQKLNANIESKNQLIKINNDEFNNKRNTTLILKYFLALLFFIILIVIGFFFKLYNANIMGTILTISFIFYVVIIYYRIYYETYTIGEYRTGKFAYDSTSSIFKNAIHI